eukprot:scaffold6783_cov61-Phaeocystis_antarctica.AAC.3
MASLRLQRKCTSAACDSYQHVSNSLTGFAGSTGMAGAGVGTTRGLDYCSVENACSGVCPNTEKLTKSARRPSDSSSSLTRCPQAKE